MTTIINCTPKEINECKEFAEEVCRESCQPYIHNLVIEQFEESAARRMAMIAVHEHLVTDGIVNVGEYKFNVVGGWVV